ncbi:MAG: hypothetical protein ACK41P_01130 [Asticcacaulis sp.]
MAHFILRRSAILGAFVSALALAGCQTETEAPPPVVQAPQPPKPSLSPVVAEAAAIYVNYIAAAQRMDANFADADMVQAKLAQGTAYEPAQLARGAVAYAAIVAMQDPAFRAEVAKLATDPQQRHSMAANLFSDPSYARVLPGADSAARRAIEALKGDGEAVYNAGAGIKQAAYDIQRQKWAKDHVKVRDARLATVKQNSSTPLLASSDHSAELIRAALAGQGLKSHTVAQSAQQSAKPASTSSDATKLSDALTTGGLSSPISAESIYAAPYSATIERALAIAALGLMGNGSDLNAEQLNVLLDDGSGARCLSMSKLNLYQCLSVAKPHYEDVFCTGQHVLMDTGQCLGRMASPALSLAPVRVVKYNADGSAIDAYAKAKPYLAPPAPAKKPTKKGSKSKKK